MPSIISKLHIPNSINFQANLETLLLIKQEPDCVIVSVGVSCSSNGAHKSLI